MTNDLIADIERAKAMFGYAGQPTFLIYTQDIVTRLSIAWGIPAGVCDVCGCAHFNPLSGGVLCFSCGDASGVEYHLVGFDPTVHLPKPFRCIVLDEAAPAPTDLGLHRRRTYCEPLPADRKRWWDK